MIFFIQLAKLTSDIEISFLDLLQLYAFMIPRIIIFTFPVSFFIALTLCLYRLSRENESIVFFTLGISPKFIASFCLKLSAFASLCMLIVSWVFIPIAFNLQENFIDYKKSQINFNLKTGQFGQKFSSWFIFISSQENNTYKDIVMYHPQNSKDELEQFVIAKLARLENHNNSLVLRLENGKIYNFENNQSVVLGEFKDMIVNTAFNARSFTHKPFYLYFEDINSDDKKAKEFVIYTLIALFPLASTLFALSFGIVTYRYEKGFAYFGIFVVIALYFGVLSAFYKPPLLATLLIFSLCFGFSILYFKAKILNRY